MRYSVFTFPKLFQPSSTISNRYCKQFFCDQNFNKFWTNFQGYYLAQLLALAQFLKGVAGEALATGEESGGFLARAHGAPSS